VLKVSISGYYAWRNRPISEHGQSDVAIGDALEVFFERSRSTYGRPRLAGDLRDAGIKAGGKRLARLMRERHIRGASRRKGFKTTVRDMDTRPALDLVDRKFSADAPDRELVASSVGLQGAQLRALRPTTCAVFHEIISEINLLAFGRQF
jgi:putative transposase